MEYDIEPERYTRDRRGSIYQTVRVGAFQDQGKREKMEDVHGHTLWEAISIDSNSNIDLSTGPPCKRIKTDVEAFNTKVSFFLVCDGHGGKSAADFVYDKLFTNILGQEDFTSNPVDAIKQAFKEIDEEYLQFALENELEAGTTVTMVMIVGSTLYVANVGDSEAVLCNNGPACVITEQHTLANLDELKRIHEAGGRLIGTPKHSRLGHPVLNPSLINIGVTRSIGDPWFKTKEWVKDKASGLISVPFVDVRQLTSEDQFLIMASDGFWDTMSYQEVVNYVLVKMKTTDCNTLCQELVALSKKTAHDNITVVLIKFKDTGSLAEQSPPKS